VTRERLPNRRKSETIKAKIRGDNLYLGLSRFPDGRIAEIFLKSHKQGVAMHEMMRSFAILVSLALQYGTPVDVIVEGLAGTDFEPKGTVEDNPDVTSCSSLLDYLTQVLTAESKP
jgi:ribonucleoside-diphosphate reductase alpha chain